MLSQILDILFGGILLGAVYAVAALGLSLTMGIMGVVNVSHSAFVMLGSFLALELLERLGVDPIASFFIALPLFFAIRRDRLPGHRPTGRAGATDARPGRPVRADGAD